MNFVAATLLLVMSTEEDGVLDVPAAHVERLLPADYYTDGLTGVRIDCRCSSR